MSAWSYRLSGAFAGFLDRLSDPMRRRRALLALVAAYAAAWTIYGVVAKSSQDINADMAEMVIWSRAPALGYPKHPPLLAYVVKLWFAVFPFSDWAFILLAVLTVSAGVYLAFELCGAWLDREKNAAVPFLLATIPFYNFLGLKFDQNSALIPLWALAMLALVRSMQTRSVGWAALTGLAAAAAMLTKYWSGFLLAALAFAALADNRRADYLRSPAPWISALVFILAFAPHAVWLVREDFPPLAWVGTRRIAQSGSDFLVSLGQYAGGAVGYPAVAVLLVATLIRPPGAALRDSAFALDPARRAATVLFWTPLLLPVLVALVLRTDLQPLWNASAFNLLPVVLLASPLTAVTRSALLRLAAIVTGLTLIAVAASPIVALAILKRGVENNAAYARLAAAAAEREWRETTDAPLRLVTGPFALADAAAFYMADRPLTYADFGDIRYSGVSPRLSPWVSAEGLAREGAAILCPAADDICLDDMARLAATGPPGRRREVTLTRHWLGLAGSPRRFVIATVPPRP